MFFSIKGVVQIHHVPSVSSCQPMHCSGMDFLGDPMHRIAVAFSTLLSSFSITLTAQFTHSHLIFKPNDPDHVSFSAPWWGEPSLLIWDNWETRRTCQGNEAFTHLAVQAVVRMRRDGCLSWRMEASSHWLAKCLPMEVRAQSCYQALQGKGVGPAKMNSTVIKWLI